MKHCSLLAFACFLVSMLMLNSLPANAQYGNEWITSTGYNKTYYKFKTTHNGLHRLTQANLASAGIPLTGANFKVFTRGQEIPIYVSTNGTFGVNDYVEFYGEANDGYFDTQMYADESYQANPYFSNFEDEGTYFIVSDSAGNGLRFDQTSNNLTNVPAKETYFMYESVEDAANTFHFGKPKTGVGSTSSFTADFGIGEGYCTSTISYLTVAGTVYNDKKLKVETEGAVNVSGVQAKVTTRVIGKNQSSGVYFDKDFDIRVNGTNYIHSFGSDSNLPSSIKLHGYETKDFTFNLPLSQLDAEETEVWYHVFDGQGTSGFPFETEISVGFTKIEYPHNFNFQGESEFKFNVDVPTTKYFELTNFNGGSAPVIYDITSNKRITPVVSGGVYKFKLEPTTDLNRTIFISSTSISSLEYVSGFTARNFQNVTSSGNQGDYVLIYNKQLQNGCGIDQIQRYINYRESAAGGSYQVAAYEIEDLYDQFAHGIDKHGMSVKQFINYAVDNWNPEAEIINLLGKGVQYNLYRFFPEAEAACLVPSYGHKASDLMLTSRTTTGFAPQVAIGRIPAFTCDQVRAYIDKLVEYEALYNAPCDRDSRDWMNDALHISKGWGNNETDKFLEDLEIYEGQVTTNLMGMDVVETLSNNGGQISSQPCGTYEQYFETVYNDQQQVRPHLENGLNLINYVGHSIGQNWQYDMGEPTDYDNEGKYPFILSNSCFVGKINEYNTCNGEFLPCMAEDWVLSDNHGSIGFLAAVALSTPSFLQIYTTELMENLGTDPLYGQEIGLSVQQTVLDLIFQIQTNQLTGQDAEAAEITCYEFTFCGDPAIRLYSFEEAEFEVITSDISVSNSNINSAIDSDYTVYLEYHNNGRNEPGPIPVEVTQRDQNGNIVYTNIFFVNNPVDGQVYEFEVPVVGGSNDGTNTVTVTVDPNNEFPEQCIDNNSATLNISVVNPACSGNESASFALNNTLGVANEICIDSPLEVTFDGVGSGLITSFGNNATVTQNGANYSVSYANSGLKTITFTVGSGECETTETQQVNVVEPLEMPVLECEQISTGILSVNWAPINGVSTYIVRINGGGATPTLNTTYSQFGVQPGSTVTFEVQASGSNACGSGPIAIIECIAEEGCTPPAVTNFSNLTICEGDDASFSAQPIGGVYALNGQSIGGSQITGLTAGSYTVSYEVGDTGCKTTETATVTVNEAADVQITGNTTVCDGETSTLLLSENVTGVSWSTGESTPTIAVTTAGNYSVTYTDENGCTGTASIAVTASNNSNPTAAYSLNGNGTICAGESVSFTNSSSNSSNYQWTLTNTTNNQTVTSSDSNPSITLNEAGTYSVSLSAFGCGTNVDVFEETAIITVEDKPEITIIASNPTPCEGEVITLIATGGSNYNWSGVDSFSGNTATISGNATAFVSGGNANGCIGNEQITVNYQAKPNIQYSLSNNNPCEGDLVTITATGATTYSFGGADSANGAVAQVTVNSDLTVTLQGESNNGCQSDLISIPINVSATPTVGGPQNLDCVNGTFTIAGTNAASYSIVGDITATVSGNNPVVSFTPPASQDSLTINVTITATSPQGCQSLAYGYSFECESELDCSSVNLQLSASNLNPCEGEVVTLTATGAGAVSWIGATPGANNTATITQSSTISITDIDGCDQESLTINFQEKPEVNYVISSGAPCVGEDVTIEVTGANAYNWTGISQFNGTIATVNNVTSATTITLQGSNSDCVGDVISIPIEPVQVEQLQIAGDSQICAGSPTDYTLIGNNISNINWSNGATGFTASISQPGTYSVTYTDENGCNGSASIEVDSFNASNAQITGSTEVCEGSETMVSLSGNNISNINWSNGQVGANAIFTATGNYSVTYTDENGCTRNQSVSITVYEAPSLSIVGNTVICEGEASSVTLSADGISNVMWSNGDSGALAATDGGTYAATYVDVNGCSRNTTVTISESPNSNPIAGFTLSSESSICLGEEINLLNNSQNSDNYLWTLSNTETGNSVSSDDFSPTIMVEEAGVYSVILKATGCGTNEDIQTQTGVITVSELPVFDPTTQCIDDDIFELVIESNNNVSSYIITSSNSSTTVANENNSIIISGLNTNEIYSVEGVNENGCSTTINLGAVDCTVTGPDCSIVDLQFNASALQACEGDEITVTASGADNIIWSGVTPNIGGVATITESTAITIVDGDGCDEESIFIEFSPKPTLNYSFSSETICAGDEVTLTVTGADSYEWDVLETTNGIVDVMTDESIVYNVIGISADGCESEMLSIPFNVQPLSQLNLSSNGNTVVNGDELQGCGTGSVTYDAIGADNYSWIGAENITTTNNTVTIDWSVGTNIVTAIATEDCAEDFSFTFVSQENPTLNVNAPTGICENEEFIVEFENISGATYSFSGGLTDNGSGSATGNISETTSFEISYETPEGCNDTETFTVDVYARPEVDITNNPDVVCLDDNFTLSVEDIDGYTYTWNGANLENFDGNEINVIADEDMLGDGSYELQIVSTQGCETIYNIPITVVNKPDLGISSQNNETFTCAGEDFQLSAVSNLGTIEWSGPGIEGSTEDIVMVNITETTTFTAKSVNESGCEKTQDFVLGVYDDGTELEVPEDMAVCSYSEVALTLQDGVTALVDNSENGSVEIKDDGIQYVTVLNTLQVALDFDDENGCYKNGSFTITTDDSLCPDIDELKDIIPNVITPNGDGSNDTWSIKDVLARYADKDVAIYNRWGELLYEAANYTNAWDGTRNDKDLPDGTYYYIIYLNDVESNIISGTVTILR